MKRILVIKLSSLGDIFHAMPAVHALAKRTGATIDWVTQPEYQSLVACCPDVSRIIPYPRRNFFKQFKPFLNVLRAESYDAVVDFQGLFKSAMIGRMARAPLRVGPARSREGAHLFYDRQPALRKSRGHAIDELMDVVDCVAPAEGIPTGIQYHLQTVDGPPLDAKRPLFVFVPFSRWLTKDWPMQNFVELGKRLLRTYGGTIWIAGSKEDSPRGERLATLIGEGAVAGCGTTSIPGLLSILKQADLVISVDSGPMHAAVAVDTPVVAIFGATNPVWTGPYGQLAHVVQSPCSSAHPCHSRRCQLKALKCLIQITPEQVFHSVENRLAARHIHPETPAVPE